MTILAKVTRAALVGATVATAASTSITAPAQAEFGRVKPGIEKIIKVPRIQGLWCRNGSGDVVAHPIIRNLTGQTLSAGQTVSWTAKYNNGSTMSDTYTLVAPLAHGAFLTLPNQLPWNFTCTATVNT